MAKRSKRTAVLVELSGGKATVVGHVHAGAVALQEAYDECFDEQLVECPFCHARQITQEKRCPRCGRLMWGHFTFSGGPIVVEARR